MYHRDIIESPLGQLTLIADQRALVAITCSQMDTNHLPASHCLSASDNPLLHQAAAELCEYFAGQRKTFTLPVKLRGTPFQNSVWQTLCQIPYGDIWSYTRIAESIGNASAVRAAGRAISRNPLAIIIPCHRVTGRNGALTGFAGGLPAKRYLLALERNQ